MNVSEAIRTRRSIGKVKPDAVPQELLERIIEAGTWAPNHKMTEPWRFFVMQGEGRDILGNALGDIQAAGAGDTSEEGIAAARESGRTKAYRAPVVIGVAVEPSTDPKVIEVEEYGAVFAAIQNMLLEIHGLGLGAVWRTGEPCFHALMNEAFGLSPNGKMLGFLYIGYPDMEPKQGKRQPAADKTVWLNSSKDV
ncbi:MULTISPECIES: nitroreductase family protein [Paenibacillus]|uniref:Putative NAD(P)H nitroreductase n=2 Tax=Paenibacillus lactis TaxID=228574 RepID=G4HHC9_9BACL|nr:MULTISPECIES: nitroreductase [Paenibacillus]EHB63505.1 nitroreductase [Paenibacillus lactis 154]MBP1891786.1 nitroreductase [Paenibacillus lactis]MCM3494244.1 nitroreductase [Paenibacillus lactis]GIO89028.1 NAD(P)H nitroreductase [Paenibacillus lactis]HAF99234.1 nitroreductase [Paenibacillus lactis]